MKVTFTLQGLTASAYQELESLIASEKFDYLNKASRCGSGMEDRVKMKIATGQMCDAVELTAKLKRGPNYLCKIEPRKGYKLVTFEIN